jgi:hypothetical protein
MRGKWAFTGAAVLALVVVGGIGGLTVRAVAGVAHNTVVTKTVTRFCVYVDHTNPGDSYGDVTVLPKYKNRVCIVGKRGAAGDSSVISWNKTVATPSVPTAAKKGAGAVAHFVDLAKVGPFTVRGYCQSGQGVAAVTHVLSAQDGSSLAWDDSTYPASFNNGDDRQVSNFANGTTQSPGFVTEYTNGEFSVSTADQKTAFTGFATNGVYIQGPQGPACSFIGHLVLENY